MGNVNETLNERGSRYGSFSDVSELSQRLQNVMQDSQNWVALHADQREALQAISSKIARILNGDTLYSDNWHDIAGYAQLVERRLLVEQQEKDGWTPEAINEAAFKHDCEYTLEQVIGDVRLSDWVRWVAVDKDGEVYGYSHRPYLVNSRVGAWSASMGDECNSIKDIEPPSDFTKCIWEVKK